MPDAQKNKVKYNLKNVHYAPLIISEEGEASYGTPVKWPGAVSLSLSPIGEMSIFYADGIAYWVGAPNTGFSGDMEMALIPDDFETSCIGERKDQKGMIYSSTGDKPKAFALLFEFDGDVKAQRHCLYNCFASRSEVGSETKNEAIEPVTDKLTINATPSPYMLDAYGNNLIKIRSGDNPDSAAYASWYTKVPMPVESEG